MLACPACAGAPAGSAPAVAPKPKVWGKKRPFPAAVVAREGLCHISSKDDKDTVRVELDLGDSGLQYTPGDALGIYPTNCPEVGRQGTLNDVVACSKSRGQQLCKGPPPARLWECTPVTA